MNEQTVKQGLIDSIDKYNQEGMKPEDLGVWVLLSIFGYEKFGNKIIISVDGTEYFLSEAIDLGGEIILHADLD